MAFRRRFKRRRTRRFRRRRTRPRRRMRRRRMFNRRPTTIRVRSLNAAPDVRLCKFRWTDRKQITGFNLTGFSTATIWHLNGPFQPNLDGTGGQPLGWDNIATFYERYTCFASRIKVTFYADSAAPVRAIIYPWRESTALALDLDDASSQNKAHKTTFTNPTTTSGKTIRHYSTLFAVDGTKPYSANFNGFMASTNPASLRYWILAIGTIDEATPPIIFYEVEIVYYCRCFSRNRLKQDGSLSVAPAIVAPVLQRTECKVDLP